MQNFNIETTMSKDSYRGGGGQDKYKESDMLV